MKIAILVSHFPPKYLAGTEIATYNIVKHIAKNHEVHVITRMHRDLPRYEEKDGFFIHRVWYLDFSVLKIIYYITAPLKVLKIKPDIIHGQMIFPNGFLAVILGWLLKKPSITYVRGSDIYTRSGLFKKTIGRFVLKRSNRVIALTNDMKKEILKIVDRKDVIVVPNGIEISKFNLNRDNCRRELNIQENKKIILFVGRLIEIKGVEYLIRAMKEILKDIPDAKLMIIGDGENEKNLKNLSVNLGVEEKIDFIGKVPNDKIPVYMKAADVFVLPSLSEGFPVTLLEAMAAGLPILATKVGGIPEIIKDEENGFLVQPANSSDIAKKVIDLLADKEKMEIMKQNNKEKAKNYDWDAIVKQLVTIYHDIQKVT